MKTLTRSCLLGVAMLVGFGAFSGCVSEGPPARPAPRPIPVQPAGLVVDRVVPAIDKLADDTDRNGYYDTFRVAVFLFATGYGQSIEADGTLECRLTDPETGKELAVWRFGPEELRKAWGMSGVMPGYNLLLNMNAMGSDRVATYEALFSCQFKQAGRSEPVVSISRLVVMVGRLR